MAANNYVPGTWLGIVRSGTAILLGPGTPPQLVHSLWELLESRPEVHELLHAVTSSFGVSLASIPPFGIVDFQDSLRIFLRGDLDLTVQLAGGPVELHGRDVTTWAERHLTAPEWYRLSVPGGDPAGQSLPLQEGVVLLQALTVGLDGTVGAAAAMPVAGQRAAPAIAADPVAVRRLCCPRLSTVRRPKPSSVSWTKTMKTFLPRNRMPGRRRMPLPQPKRLCRPLRRNRRERGCAAR